MSAEATCEEMYLFARLLRDAVQGQVGGFHWTPHDAYHDSFLIDADRNPNTAGLRALGIGTDPDASLLTALNDGGVRGVVFLRTDLSTRHGDAVLDRLADRVDYVAVIDTHHRAIAETADALLPIATFAETDGTFVNRSRRVQRVHQSFAPPGDAKAGWRILGDMLAYATDTSPPATASAVFDELAGKLPAFAQLSYAAIGDRGAVLPAGTGA
jgi:predicted molibdopterin-dependent oxidoreductase YjgC